MQNPIAWSSMERQFLLELLILTSFFRNSQAFFLFLFSLKFFLERNEESHKPKKITNFQTKVFKGVSRACLERHLRARRGQNAFRRKKLNEAPKRRMPFLVRRDWGALWSCLLRSKKKAYALWELMWPWTEIKKKTLSNPWNSSPDWKLWQTQIGRKTQNETLPQAATECSTSGGDQPQCIFSNGDPSHSFPGMSRTRDLPLFVSHIFLHLHLFISFPLSASSPMVFSIFHGFSFFVSLDSQHKGFSFSHSWLLPLFIYSNLHLL